MIRTHPVLISLGLVLLCALGIGGYLYNSLPGLIQHRLGGYLEPYGVSTVAFEPIQLTSGAVLIEQLRLRGTHENVTYQLTVDSLDLRYTWHSLLRGKAESLIVSGARIAIEQAAHTPGARPASVKLSEVLPYSLIDNLPINRLQVSDWHLDYQRADWPLLSVTGTLLITDTLTLHLLTRAGGSEVTAALHMAREPASVDVNIAVAQSNSTSLQMAAHAVQAATTDWEWNLEGNWRYAPLLAWLRELGTAADVLASTAALQNVNIEGKTTVTASLRHPDKLQLAGISGSAPALLPQFKGSVHAVTQLTQLHYPTVATAVHGTLECSATLNDGQLTLTLLPADIAGTLSTALLSLPENFQHWLGWQESVPFRWENTEPILISSGVDGRWTLQTRSSTLELGDRDSRLELSGTKLDVTLTGSELPQLSTHFSTSIGVYLHKQTMPQLELAVQQQGSSERSDFSLLLSDAEHSINANIHGTLNSAVGAGEYQLQLRSDKLPRVAALTLPLLRHFKLFTQNVALDSGQLELNTTVESKSYTPNDWSQRSQLTVHNVSGSVADYRFDNLALTAQWTGISEWQTQQPAELSVASLNPGFAMRDLTLQLSLPKPTAVTSPRLQLERFSVGVFGGTLLLPQPQVWDFAAAKNHLTVQARQWQLAELVALQKNTAIQAQGTLEGELPLTIASGRVMIDQGYLRALPPGGSIRYTPDDASRALAESSTELTLALGLLSDFQFQTLSSDVALDAAGNLLLGLSLSGSNPSRYEGQPINFNIKLEQNIDPLLQSLRLSDTLVERIEGGLQ